MLFSIRRHKHRRLRQSFRSHSGLGPRQAAALLRDAQCTQWSRNGTAVPRFPATDGDLGSRQCAQDVDFRPIGRQRPTAEVPLWSQCSTHEAALPVSGGAWHHECRCVYRKGPVHPVTHIHTHLNTNLARFVHAHIPVLKSHTHTYTHTSHTVTHTHVHTYQSHTHAHIPVTKSHTPAHIPVTHTCTHTNHKVTHTRAHIPVTKSQLHMKLLVLLSGVNLLALFRA